jgi:tRNA-binding EMAP/Myf-like protein
MILDIIRTFRFTPDTDKLLKLSVDFGEFEETKAELDPKAGVIAEGSVPEIVPIKKIPKPRQIVSGIALRFPDPSVLVGKTYMFVTNLEPRMIKGYESNGMLFAVSTQEGGFSMLEPNETIPPGTLVA